MISKARAEIPADWREQPLTDGQRALWFLQRLRPEVAAWNIAAAGRVQGKLDPRRLREAFERLADRHEALRLSFHETPDGPVQRVRPGDSVDFQDEDARGWTDFQISEALQAEADRPFDLSRDPLLRVRLLRRAMDDVLLLVIHHLVADLGSLAILVRELGPLYAGETADPLSALRYAAYADGLEARLQGRTGERHWVYWREQLSGALPVLELPADRPRPPVRSFRGGLRTGRLSRGLTERFRKMGGEQRATLFMVLTAGLDVLLYRASGETDLLVGSPTYGRLAPELHGAVGYFVNPVVLRSDLSGHPTFGELLQRIRSTVLGALRHQEYPFARLVERLQPEREQTRPPIFQVMIALQRGHLPGTGDLAAFAMGIEGVEVSTGPLALTSLPLERRFSEFDLDLTVAETARGTELALAFNADLFDSATAERFLGHLVTLLEAATQDSGRRIGELPLLTEAERFQLAGWNETSCPLPERPVYELFEEQAARTPEATAISAADGILTYGELSARSNAVAQGLEEAGLLPEEPVAVWTERGTFLLTALLGILKAGGVYFPLHPDHPAPRLRGLLEKSKARLVLAADPVRCGALFPDLKVIEIGAPARERSLPRTERRLEAAAYLLFTSGSTGEPKGALVTHRGLLNHLLSKVHGLNLSPSDRVAQTAPQSFDISIWQLLAPLLAGARVEVIPDSVVREPDRLLAEIDDRGISVAQVVPSLLLPLVNEIERGAGGIALRRLITIGEALAPEVARRWLAARPEARLVNCYGPTECADGVSDAYLDTVPGGLAHTSIGRPIPNLRLYVLSPELEPQPIGFPGEVCIAGVGVGRGYLDDPGQTAAAFLPDLFSSEPGRRLYRTGDLGRRRVDGELEILGRIDHQIKVRGVRVEPAEVEAGLVSHPRVREAIVALHQGRLAAWWTGDPAAEPELREHLRKRLPEVMVPSAFRHLSALPLTPHGKVDRRTLPDPANPNPEWMEAPADELEQLLTGIFRDLLGRAQVGLRESFFDLGGHSLLAVKAIARVRKALDVDASAGLLFEEPTVLGLARRLRNLAGAPSLPSISRRERGATTPLSFAQERLWFLHRLEPGSPSYNMPGIVRLAGSVKPAELAAAISAVMNRHESLRTTFPDLAGEPWQEIAAPSAVELPVADLSCLANPEPEARRLGLEEARRPFDLGRGPLLRVFLLRLETEHRLVINLHHIVADGWSVEILAREVAAFLHGSVLPGLSIQYADFAVWQREQTDALSEQLGWWTSELGGALPPLELPADRPRPALQRQRGARVSVQIPAQTSLKLRQLAREAAATPFMVLAAAFQLLLHRLTGQDDLRIGTLAANRPRVELEGLIGLFVNTVVLRTRFGSGSSFRELIERVRERAIGAFLHQELPFEKLVEALPGRTPLFQAMLLLQPPVPATLGEFEEIDNGTAKLELTLVLQERGECFEGWIEHDTNLFEARTVQRWASSFQSLLEGGLEDPGRSLQELALLGPGQTAQAKRERRAQIVVPSAPAGPIETAIAEIWSGVLGTATEDRHQSFFDSGGHSLLATRVVSRINSAFGTGLPLRALFDQPTLAGLADAVAADRRDRKLPAFRHVPRGGPLAPSFAQERLWFMDRLNPESPVYNVAQAVDISGPLNRTALEISLDSIAARHETLRTRFTLVHGRLMQEIEPHRPRALSSVDLGGLLPELRSAEADRLTQNEARRPFGLLQGPLFHSTLLVLGETGHRLLVTLHHMICDGWSLEILAREVGALYRQESLPTLSFQYTDYADWQRRWPGEILDEQLGWWTETLAGLSPLELSTDRPRPAVQSFRGGLAAASLADQAGTLNAFAREHRATPFMVMLAAWQILLHRLTGQTDVAVGSPVANRSRPETEDLVGFFANNLVLRADLSGDLTFAEALARVRETALAAYAHQDLPFERLVAELAPERDLSRSALFQVAFSFQQAMALDLGAGLHEEILDVHTGTSKFDFWLQVEPSKEGWRLRAEYAADLLDRATVHRRLGNLRVLLAGIAASPETRISDLPLLTPEEIDELTSWNQTAFETPQEPVHRLFRLWAERTPDALAIAWDGGEITYRDLASRADRLASWLREEGAGPETVVALRMERSPDLVTAALAILEAGGAYLPIDPANPPERVKWILEDSGALMELTEGMAFPEAAPTAAPAMPDPDLLAYVIYTSGSTGTPKGAELRHRSLSSFIAWHRRARGLGPSDRTTMIAGPGFDASVMEIWGALTSGASLHIPPQHTMFSPAALLTWLAEQRITVSFMPTPLAEAVLAEPLPEGLALRALLTGGDRLRSRPAPGLPFGVINHYGPTETTIAATVGPVEPLGEQAPDIGSPVGNSRAYVLDRNLRQVPLGAPGELCVAGDSLARGYRGRPDLTAERFVPDPFGAAERLYRTGDLARWLPDGKLHFLGRIDHQVKVRGLRIELGEIESLLRHHPRVRQAVVTVIDGRALTAYYVPDPEREPSSDELRTWLSRKLPAIMVPAVYVQLDELPLTVNGKIDRRALPAPPIDPPPSLETPRTLMQTLVAGVFGEVLGVSPVPLNVRFFDLGGNSLMATQVVTILQDVLPIELDLRKVIEGPTVARLAAVLEEERAALPEREREATAEILAELESSLFVTPNAA